MTSGKKIYWGLDRLERYFVAHKMLIPAIKALRERKNLGLREAKNAIDDAMCYVERYPTTGYEVKQP